MSPRPTPRKLHDSLCAQICQNQILKIRTPRRPDLTKRFLITESEFAGRVPIDFQEKDSLLGPWVDSETPESLPYWFDLTARPYPFKQKELIIVEIKSVPLNHEHVRQVMKYINAVRRHQRTGQRTLNYVYRDLRFKAKYKITTQTSISAILIGSHVPDNLMNELITYLPDKVFRQIKFCSFDTPKGVPKAQWFDHIHSLTYYDRGHKHFRRYVKNRNYLKRYFVVPK